MASYVPNARQQFCDSNGKPLAAGSVGMYVTGTLTPKNTWQDVGATTLNANPIPLDSGGYATIYGDGEYRQIVKDSLGNTIYDEVVTAANVSNQATIGGGGASISVAVNEAYNPGSATGWTNSGSYSPEGVSVDMGGYGPRQFGTAGTPSALNGSVNIPATATIINHSSGVSGYAKSASTTTGGVALYGEANREATNALVWGLNARVQDNGFGGLTVWGCETDLNIDNATTNAVGFAAVGASTVEPTTSVAYWVESIGIDASPKKRWQYGLRSTDAGAIIGIELGAQTESNNAPSQIFQLRYRDGSGTPTVGYSVQVDGTTGLANLTGSVRVIGSLGYGTGSGGAVTQGTSRTTGVTLNKACGQITLFSAAGSATWATFTVTNSTVAATDVVRLNQASGTDKYMLHVTHVGAGSFDVTFATTGGTTTEQPVFNFAVIKAVAA